MIATAGRDINVATTTRSASSSAGANQFNRSMIDRVGSLSVTGAGGTLVANAGRMPGQSTFAELDRTYLSDEQHEVGYERFVAEHPELVFDLERMGPEMAKILGIDYQKARRKTIAQGLERDAREHGIDSFEYLLRYAVESAAEREDIVKRRRDAINKILGK